MKSELLKICKLQQLQCLEENLKHLILILESKKVSNQLSKLLPEETRK